MAAIISNPRKNFAFRVALVTTGLFNPYSVQEVKTPDEDIDQVEHGQGNHKIKTAGQINFGNGTLKGLVPQDFGSTWINEWIMQVQNAITMGGFVPGLYKRDLKISYLNSDGVTPGKWEIWQGAWPCKLAGKELNAIGSENIFHDIEFSVDKVINSPF